MSLANSWDWLVAVRPRNSTTRCLLLYCSRILALPFTMVVRVLAQVPKVPPRLPAANTLTKPLPPSSPSSGPRSARIPPALNSLPYFPSPRRCTQKAFTITTFSPSDVPTLLFASTYCLFVVSLHSFLHSFPLFSVVCSLFSQNTRGGGVHSVSSL